MRHANRKFNSPDTAPHTVPLLTLGFCVDKAGEAQLVEDGVEPKLIWMRGRQAENIDWAIDYFRGCPGVLKVANDLRVFGPTRKEIFARTADLSRRCIKVEDIRDPGANLSELEHKALIAMNAASGTKNRRQARYRGSKGGTAKGVSAWRERNEIAPEWLLRNMVAEIGAKRTAALLENKISASSLSRHYGAAA